MSVPRAGPCADWITVDEILGCGSCTETVLSTATADVIDQAIGAASEVLYAKSGRTFTGECEATVRPCCASSLCDCLGSGRYLTRWGMPYGDPLIYGAQIVAGDWYNLSGSSLPCVAWDCGQQIPTLDLGRGPVTEITEVRIDGAVLDADAYRIDGHRYLVRTDGESWPAAQDLLADDTETGTWSVTFEWGWPIPDLGVAAASELACNLLLAFTGDDACQLPKRVVSATRQGITFNLQDIMSIIEKGGVGLYATDLFIGTYNPEHLARPPRVVNIDRPRGPRVVG